MKAILLIVLLSFVAGCAQQGIEASSTCQACPQPPAPNFCAGGETVPGDKDECGCQQAPTCRSYLTKDPDQCSVMGVWECEPGRRLFTDPSGCGCEDEPGFTRCPEERPEACNSEYEPVCGLLQVQCITTPCNPIPQTYGNACGACIDEMVIGHRLGECP